MNRVGFLKQAGIIFWQPWMIVLYITAFAICFSAFMVLAVDGSPQLLDLVSIYNYIYVWYGIILKGLGLLCMLSYLPFLPSGV